MGMAWILGGGDAGARPAPRLQHTTAGRERMPACPNLDRGRPVCLGPDKIRTALDRRR
jgi:hypothetical protein